MTCAEHLRCQALEANSLLEIGSQRVEGQNHALTSWAVRVLSLCPKADRPHTSLLKDSSQVCFLNEQITD